MARSLALVLLASPLAAHSSANSAPVAETDYVDLKDASQAFNVLANDKDADGDKLILVSAAARVGAVAFTRDGLVAYAAGQKQSVADEITYVLSDGRGGYASGKVIVVIR